MHISKTSPAAFVLAAALFVGWSEPASAQATLFDFQILYEIDGDSADDLLGGSVDGVGDLDGDGIDDFAIGIQRDDPGGIVNAGTVTVFSGGDGSVLFSLAGDSSTSFFGNEVRGAGDVDKDGTPDIIVAAIFDDAGSIVDAGSASVFSGADGSLIYGFEGDTTAGWFGRGVDGAGDVNGDGYADLIVGSRDDSNGNNSGSVSVFSGLDGTTLYFIPGGAAGDSLGITVAGLGDVDGDGFDDFAAGARGADTANGSNSGRITVFSGADASVLYVFDGESPNYRLLSVGSAGDVNGDDIPDIMTGAPDAGRVRIFSGADGSLLYVLDENSPGDQFGRWVTSAGDVNYDGFADMLVGAPTDDRGGAGAGSATVFSGADGSVLFTVDGDPGDSLGSAVGALGNVNGDLCDDFIVGAFLDDNTFANSGSAKIYVFSGEVCTPDTTAPTVSVSAPGDGDILGSTSVLVVASVIDDSPTDVLSSPPGLSAAMAAGGGSASGWVALVEGDNTIAVNATDVAGNVGGTSVSVIRDTIAPAVTLLSPSSGAVLASELANLTFQIDDATATTVTFGANSVAVPRGGGPVAGSVALAEGANTVSITAVDEAGNATTVSFGFIVDLTAPVIAIESPPDGACFGAGSSTVGVTATVDDLTDTTIATAASGMAPSLPAGGGALTGAFALAEGPNVISITATDTTGRASTAQVSVTLDSTPPSVSLTSPGGGTAIRGTVDFSAVATEPASGSGVDRVDFYVDGSSFMSLSAPPFDVLLDTATLADGPRSLTVSAVDAKGNVSSSSISVIVDNTAPDLSVVAPGDGDLVAGTIAIDLQSSDATSGLVEVEVLAGGAPPTTDPSASFAPPQASALLTGGQDTVPLPDGALTITARAVDDAGNESSMSVSVQVDNTAPQKFLLAPSDGDVVSGTIDITADGIDANLDHLEILVGGASIASSTTAPFTVSYDTTTTTDGALEVTAVVVDLAGNRSSCTATVKVDNVASWLTPQTLNMNGRGNGKVMAHLGGAGLEELLPTEDHAIELHVPGGSPVASEVGYGGDDSVEDGRLNVRFSRRQLQNAINAGIAAGQIQSNSTIVVTLYADGNAIGTDLLRINN